MNSNYDDDIIMAAGGEAEAIPMDTNGDGGAACEFQIEISQSRNVVFAIPVPTAKLIPSLLRIVWLSS